MIRLVDPDEDRSTLEPLLTDFHAWMVDHAGDVYEPGAELAEDLQSLADDPESWAWVAAADDTPAGCVLLYGTTDDLAEFKRLWVRPAFRGTGLGRALVETVVDSARAEGYEVLGLTTPPWAERSHALYESLGFERTPPYPDTRLPEKYHDEAVFMQRTLDDEHET